jgi:hypothetical protein
MVENVKKEAWVKPTLDELPIGQTASGSTTFARELITVLGGPYFRSG